MANRIPRTASKLRVTWKHGTSACPAGTTTEAWKDDNGWHMEQNGKSYYIFVSMLRNADICDIKVIG